MKVFVFTYDRFDSISTSEYFRGLPHTVLCHTEEQRQKFLAAGRIHTPDLIATGAARGLAYNRNAALDMMQPSEWAVFFVDDLLEMTCLDTYETECADELPVTTKNGREFKARFSRPLPAGEFLQLAEGLTREAERRGLALVGFSLTPNPLFRRKKYSTWSLADGRCWLVRKTHLRFDENVQLIDDTCFTALNLRDFHGVLVDNWILPLCKRYTAGAFGSIEQRMPQKLREAAYLVNTYPSYVQFAEKTGWPTGSHVKIRQPRRSKII